jgi:1-deoxy-D-xylulose-5-phosphate reductoisomerase
VDVVLGGLVGSVGLVPAYEAVKAGKTLALANKETLVVAGEPLMRKARETGAAVLPVDSEHCALHQALRAGAAHEVQRLTTRRALPPAPSDVRGIPHPGPWPTWKMGRRCHRLGDDDERGLEVISPVISRT